MDNGRRFRGMLGIATIWAIALSTVATGSLAISMGTGLVPSFFGARELIAVATRGLLVGALSGGLFAALLAYRERGHSLTTLSSRRVAFWGFIAAGILPSILALATNGVLLPTSVLVAGTVAFGSIGALLSTTTLRMARRAELRLTGADADLRRVIP